MGAPAQPPPPEATLIRLVREAAGLSPERAAARMEVKFSGSRWRQIERGWRADSGTEVFAPDVTLAQMCWALGITSDRLAETGRDTAVEILREMERSKAPAPGEAPESNPLAELEEWQQKVILNALDEKPRSQREKALLLRTLAAKIEAQEAEEEDQESSAPGRSPGRSAQ
ncbi:helix-turn-helix domain-containing protein [Streptomyces sp. NPDC054940]